MLAGRASRRSAARQTAGSAHEEADSNAKMYVLVLTAKMLSAETPSERSHCIARFAGCTVSGHCRPRFGTPTAPGMSSATRFTIKHCKTNQIIHVIHFFDPSRILRQDYKVFNGTDQPWNPKGKRFATR